MQYSTFARSSLARTLAQGLAYTAFTSLTSAQEAAPATAVSAPTTTAAAAAQPQAAEFTAGLEALSQARNEDAAKLFRSAFDTDHNPAALVNLGIAYTNLGRTHAAVQALEEYLRHADTLRDASTMQAVTQEISRLRKDSGRIGLHLLPQHASVELDGVAMEVPNGELLASPGRHTISAHADGYAPFSQSLDVVAGQFTLEIQLTSLAVANAAVSAPAAPTSTAAVAATGPDAHDSEQASQCAFGNVCVGPVLALLGPPNLIGGGLHARIGHYLGVGVDYQMLPTLNLNPISFGSSLVSANARVYPFGGAFFLSGGFGYQSFHGVIRDGSVAISAKTSFPALMASFGFMGRSGFILGADLGLLFPLGTLRARVTDESGSLAQSGIPQSDMDEARTKAENTVNKALNTLPLLVQVNLLRVGYMF